MTEGDDLVLSKRYMGTFAEECVSLPHGLSSRVPSPGTAQPRAASFRTLTHAGVRRRMLAHTVATSHSRFACADELQYFPFDVQELHISMGFNVRTTGMVPVEISLSQGCNSIVANDGFKTLHQIYNLDKRIRMEVGEVGTHPDRMFPAVAITALTVRRSGFYVYNMLLPCALFVVVAATAFCEIPENIGNRQNVSMAMLLTIVAFKYAVATSVPSVSYLTIADKYMLSCAGIIVIIVRCPPPAPSVVWLAVPRPAYAPLHGGLIHLRHPPPPPHGAHSALSSRRISAPSLARPFEVCLLLRLAVSTGRTRGDLVSVVRPRLCPR